MINIDKDYLITVDLKNTKVKSDKTIFFYNTDLNICNIFIKLICTDEDKTIPEDLIVEFAVLKPETDEFKPLDATLISKEDLLYQVDLTTDYFDIIGKYSCEIRVSGTIENESKCFTSEEFDYVVRPNITAKLNKKISENKNLPILEKLIKDVKEITDGINKNEIQMKRDENLVGDNKTVVGAINQLREDVDSGIGGGTVELKDYQKKNDEFLNTDEKTITGGINEVNNKIKKVQESQIELDKDDVSFNGVDDISHDELNTTNKTIIGAINEVNTQYKDIANKTIIEDNKLYLVKPDGTKLDDGTTLPTYVASNNIETYKCEEIGELFDQPGDNKYLAWPAGNLKYDKNIDKFVCMILACPAHIHSTSLQYVTYIDKKTYKAEIPIRCKFYDTDKTTELTLSDEGFCSFSILNDGNYMFVKPVGSVFYRFISEDNGRTWYKSEVSNATVQFWNITKLSNGRLIASKDEANKGLWYSDDEGVTWTNTKPSGNPGNYNAEGTILELSENNLMCIARKNMGGSNDGDSAIISYSTDNGTTWSEWRESTSITDMNASCATGVVHDNLVEIFVCSRYSSSTTMYNNTGKFGVVNHYVATIENALNDKFTYKGTITECKGISTNAQQDFHCPCVAIDDNNELLLTYFDRTYPYNIDETTYYFIRGSLNGMLYGCYNQEGLRVKPYSGSHVDKLLNEQYIKLLSKIEQIKIDSGGGSTTPDTELTSYILNTETNFTYGGKNIDTGVELFKENENFTIFIDFAGSAENNLGTVVGCAYQGKIDDTSYPGFDLMIKGSNYMFCSTISGAKDLGIAKTSTERQTYAIRKDVEKNTFELIKTDGTKLDFNDKSEYFTKTFEGTTKLGSGFTGNSSNWIGTIYHCEIYKIAYSNEAIIEKLNSYLN